MNTLPLTAKQETLWRFVRSCNRSPTFREMAAAIGTTSTGEIHRLLAALENKGLIKRVGDCGPYRMARSLVAVDQARTVLPPLSQYPLADLEREIRMRRGQGIAA